MLFLNPKKYLHSKAYGPGSRTADTDDIDEDIPQLSTLKRPQNCSGDLDFLQEPTSELPDEIKLRMTLKPIPLPQRTITAQLQQTERLLEICNFYNIDNLHRNTRDIHQCTLWSGIDLIFDGTAFYHKNASEWLPLPTIQQFKLDHQKNQVIGRYEFVLPDQSHYFQINTRYKQNHKIVQLGDRIHGINISALIPYAGYIEQPLKVSSICQTYALISEAPNNKTHLTLYTQHYCNKNNIQFSLPQCPTPFDLCADSKYLSTIRLTLAGWLMQGYLKISAHCLATNTQPIYHSKDYQQTDPNTGMVDVIFHRVG